VASEATRKRLNEQDSDSDDEGPAPAAAKRSRTDQASNKARREKARREKINERFAELAALLDEGKEPKTDKPTILAEAIKYVKQLRVEHSQLRQLNKFLEERVGQYERERGQALYQHSLMLQHGMHPMPTPGM
jgi:hemerythrin-like domain-containing protein